MSVDGARIAVVSTDDKGRAARLDVAGLGRDAAGSPTAVSSMAMQLGATLDHIRDVVWTSPTELAVLAGRDTKALPHLVTLGDEITALAPIDRAQSITTLGGSRNLAITSDQGHVFVRAGDHWQALPPSASELIAPGPLTGGSCPRACESSIVVCPQGAATSACVPALGAAR